MSMTSIEALVIVVRRAAKKDKIKAIRLVRERYPDTGLKGAKEFVDWLTTQDSETVFASTMAANWCEEHWLPNSDAHKKVYHRQPDGRASGEDAVEATPICRFWGCTRPATCRFMEYPSCEEHRVFARWMIEHLSEWHALVDSLVSGNVSEVSADNPVSEEKNSKRKSRRR